MFLSFLIYTYIFKMFVYYFYITSVNIYQCNFCHFSILTLLILLTTNFILVYFNEVKWFWIAAVLITNKKAGLMHRKKMNEHQIIIIQTNEAVYVHKDMYVKFVCKSALKGPTELWTAKRVLWPVRVRV